jgi:sialate O-acetylesterase
VGNQPDRQWVKADYDMSTYTLQRMTDEVRMTNVFLEALDEQKKRTFAFTCGDMKIGDSSFIEGMKNDFVAARGVRSEMHPISDVNLYHIDCYAINGHTGEQMVELVKKSMQANRLLVFLFHGVGGEHSLNVSLPAHRALLHFLKQNEKDIWIAPMLDVAEYVKRFQSKKY